MTREICSHLGSLGFSFKIATVSEIYTGDLLQFISLFIQYFSNHDIFISL